MSLFPIGWNNSKIMNAVSDVTVNNSWVQQTGRAGSLFIKNGQPVKFIVEGTKIRVVATHTQIITAFSLRQ